MSVRTARLDDVCQVNPRMTPSLLDNDIVSFLPMAAVSETGQISYEEERHFHEVKKGYTYFKRGDVLVAKITPCFENGKATRTSLLENEVGFGSTEFHVLRPGPEIDTAYMFYIVWNSKFREIGAKNMTGSAGQKRVPADFLRRLKIPLPPLDEQRRIAAILDKADGLRRKRKQVLQVVNGFTESIFLDRFGDPAINPHAYAAMTFGEMAEKMSDGPFGSNLKSSHYVDDGIRVVRLQNIGVGQFIDNDRAYISADHFTTLKKHECLPGDVLIGTLGDPNLRACLQPAWLRTALNKADCVQFRPNTRVALPEYIVALINQPSTEALAQSLMLGQTRTRISMGRLRDLALPIAPLIAQKKFVAISKSVQERRQAMTSAAASVEGLFRALQHRAFSGQL